MQIITDKNILIEVSAGSFIKSLYCWAKNL